MSIAIDGPQTAALADTDEDGVGIAERPAGTVRLMRGPVTAEKLAKKLGLSRATVSIVLRGDAVRRKISDQTTQRVLDAAREYNYVPNQAARMLRRQRTDIVGVILPDFRLDWAERVMDGMLEIFDASPCSPFVAIHRFNPDLFRKEALAAVQRRDDALICYPMPGMADVYDQVASMGIPLVFIFDRPTDFEAANWVIWDAEAAASVAVRHLVEQGYKRIGFLGMDFPMRMSQARFEAYRTVLTESGLPINKRWISMPSSSESLGTIVESGLDKILSAPTRPDALFVLNDGTALPALDSLRRRGIRVPQDLAVISLGDVPLAGHSAIGLSTMREPLAEMGRGAAEIALKLITKPTRSPIHRTIDCNELHARTSTIGDRWDTLS